MTTPVVISCEHASDAVPARYRELFRGARAALRSHRGSDLGARTLARQMARHLGAPLVEARATRLLADPNRSSRNRDLFSEWTRGIDRVERDSILDRYWRPHRDAVEQRVRESLGNRGPVVHVSVHSFTPEWNGAERRVDIALLYDPGRAAERAFADRWLECLRDARPDLRLRRNNPYRGTADGLTTHLRRVFGADRYVGIELEVSQRFPLGAPAEWRRVRRLLCETLRHVI